MKTMNKILATLSATLLYCITTTALANHHTQPATKHLVTTELQNKLSAKDALNLLKKGNQRYLSGTTVTYNQHELGKLTGKKGQAPYAFIFSCVDSRSIPEVVFDQPLGALFVSRIAGNVISTDVLGSMEFATKYAGTKLVVIMGHTKCGAVAGACSAVDKPPQLGALLSKIQPAVQQYTQQHKKKPDCGNTTQVDSIAKQNVLKQMQALHQNSPALADMISKNKIMLVGAMHNIKTGKVDFFDKDGKAVDL